MIKVIKKAFQICLVKYWFIWLLALIVGIAGAFTHYKIESEKKIYSARIIGSTLLLNHQSLYIYSQPLITAFYDNDRNEIANVLEMKVQDLPHIKNFQLNAVSQIAEESDVRYEFLILMDIENDTSGLNNFEMSLIKLIKNHSLLISLKKNTDSLFSENNNIIENELSRINKELSGITNIADREMLHKRISELKMEQNQLLFKRKKIYDIKIVQSFKESIIKKNLDLSKYLKIWLGLSLITGILVIIILDKELRQTLSFE